MRVIFEAPPSVRILIAGALTIFLVQLLSVMTWFDHLPIGKKLILSVAPLILVVILITGAGITGISKINEQIQKLYDDRFDPVVHVAQAEDAL